MANISTTAAQQAVAFDEKYTNVNVDRNPKDFILYTLRDFELVDTGRDNAQEGTYRGRVVPRQFRRIMGAAATLRLLPRGGCKSDIGCLSSAISPRRVGLSVLALLAVFFGSRSGGGRRRVGARRRFCLLASVLPPLVSQLSPPISAQRRLTQRSRPRILLRCRLHLPARPVGLTHRCAQITAWVFCCH